MRWYQNAVINGETMPVRRRGDTSQQRWSSLLAPLVPQDGSSRLLVELGCNAGYYLREARALGYRAIGVERDPAFIEQAHYWESQEPAGVEIVQADFNDWDVPACYVCLLACVHYWQTADQLRALFQQLYGRAVYLIVMGKHRGQTTYPPDRRSLLRLLGDWEIVDQTRTARHYAILAHAPKMCELDVETLYANQRAAIDWTDDGKNFFPAFEEYIRLVLTGKRFDLTATAFCRYLRRRRLRYWEFMLEAYRDLVPSVRDNGILRPLVVRADGKRVLNGNHRLAIAKELGIEKVICVMQ